MMKSSQCVECHVRIVGTPGVVRHSPMANQGRGYTGMTCRDCVEDEAVRVYGEQIKMVVGMLELAVIQQRVVEVEATLASIVSPLLLADAKARA